MTDQLARVVEYHDGTKHHYHRFARSLGYLDWASQPKPFRSFRGAPTVALFPAPQAEPPAAALPAVSYDALYGGASIPSAPVSTPEVGWFLRHSLGLSAWKVYERTRWSLRVNPSSGNLHPTEAYVIDNRHVWHYDVERHALEERCRFDAGDDFQDAGSSFLIALTSIHWRESWKYGERAFRYCQHDIGHAIAAVRLSAAMCGWRAAMLPGWSNAALASLTGVDRDQDYIDAEPEDPACVIRIETGDRPGVTAEKSPGFIDAVRAGRWTGRANQLSEDHVQWTFIDDVAEATSGAVTLGSSAPVALARAAEEPDRGLPAQTIILQRRSAVQFDGISAIDQESFLRVLRRVMPACGAPWDVLWWAPRIHLVLFVHRVIGMESGLYLLARDRRAERLLRSAIGRDFDWHPAADGLPFWRLRAVDLRGTAKRVSCDQDIAADGFFSLGMLADFDGALRDHGAAFYRRLFWEAGVVGQVLYLEAEAAGARGTGIGCFYDDGVHELLKIRNHALQSLYHFTVGAPVDDARLTTEPGYAWQVTSRAGG